MHLLEVSNKVRTLYTGYVQMIIISNGNWEIFIYGYSIVIWLFNIFFVEMVLKVFIYLIWLSVLIKLCPV